MKVLLFAPYAKWGPHLETDLEIAEDHLAAGDEVVWVRCSGLLEACEPNPDHVPRDCAKCVGRCHAGIELLQGPVTEVDVADHVTEEDRARAAALPTAFRDFEDIKSLTLDGLDLGYAGLSSIVWCARDANVDLGHESDLLGRFLRGSALAYLALRRYLQAHPVDRVYVFNGRMAPTRAALRAAQDLGIEVLVHERGSGIDRYALTPNAMPHEIHAITKRIHDAWADPAVPEAEKVEVADAWYARRAKGVIGHWHSFTDQQAEGSLPDDWDPSRRNIAFYGSSEYEFASIGEEWKNPLFDVPTEGIVRVAETLSAAGQVHLTIRMHPNPDGSDSTSAQRLRALELPNVTIVPPESAVCSYALMRAADTIVTTSSTVGIESTYWGKPSIAAGRSLWCELGAAHHPTTFDELIDWIHDPDLPPVDRTPALWYGYDQATFGQTFRHFVPTNLFDGTFKGQVIKPKGLDRLRVKWLSIGSRARKLIGVTD